MNELKELSGIEKLEAVKTTLEVFGYSFAKLTVKEAFMLFHIIDDQLRGELDADISGQV
jgi:hypothetical protein